MAPPRTSVTRSNPTNPRLMRVRVRSIENLHVLCATELLLLNIACRKSQDTAVGGEHTKWNVVVKRGQVIDDLLVEGQTAGEADEIALGEEAVIEAHAPADALAAAREAKP